MTTKNFYNDQSDLTAAKIQFLNDYIYEYCIKLLMQYGNCAILDLFCGKGKNGNKDGSPLVLLNQAQQVLSFKGICERHSNPEVFFWFNDNIKENIENLKTELGKITLPKGIPNAQITNQSFNAILPILIAKLKTNKIPKFFFLDPFKYSSISVKEVLSLFELPNTEILLFLPTFQAYRFATDKRDVPEKLRIFLEEFTTQGPVDYGHIDDFNAAIVSKLRSILKTAFVRPILLDDGSRKHTLFFITKHPLGAHLMNRVAWSHSSDGKGMLVRETKKNAIAPTLFDMNDVETTGTFYQKFIFGEKLEACLKKSNRMSNEAVFSFTASEGFLPKHANQALRDMLKQKKIKLIYTTPKNKGFYVSEDCWNKKMCEIHYQETK